VDDSPLSCSLDALPTGSRGVISWVGGPRAFRRRLMELGLLPGTLVQVLRVAPLGDPLELRARGCSLSIRRGEAREIRVQRVAATPAAGEPS
jgi:ferrous iron transport protein A